MAEIDLSILKRWEEIPELKYWLNGGHGGKPKAEKTKRNYLSSMRTYMEFRGMGPEELIQEAREARQKEDYLERTLPEAKISEFHSWLISEYEQKSRGWYGKRKGKGKKGVSETLAHSIIGAIRGFYRSNGFPLDVKLDPPAPKEENFSFEIRAEHVRKLLNHTRSLRDRAAILTMFQSGIDVQTLCRLNYGHVAQDLEDGKVPVMLHLIRKKPKVKFKTFIGRDALVAIKAYLEERSHRGEKITHDSPLFLQEGKHKEKNKRLQPRNLEDIVKTLVVQSGIISQERIEQADINPARPYALRAAFSSIMGYKGVDRDTVNFFMGHKMPYNSAYHRMTREELEVLYKKGEEGLSISGTRSMSEVEEKLREEFKESYGQVIQDLQVKNNVLEQRLEEMEKKLRGLENIGRVESEIMELVEKVRERKA